MSETLVTDSGVAPARQMEDERIAPDQGSVSAAAVRQQLERILGSRVFARSPRISRFLGFVVDQTLAGQDDKLKEYLLGVEVFNRMDSFDPRIDSIVRVEARRLRYKLDRYYETEGREDVVHIQFRKGCYVPTFAFRTEDQVQGDIFDFPHLNKVENPHAFASYAKGRHHTARWTADGIAESLSCFNQAATEQPDSAVIRGALASAWMLSGLLGIMPGKESALQAREAATAALRLKHNAGEAQAVEAFARAVLDFEWREADSYLRRSIPVNPCDRGPRLWYALCAMLCGRQEDAIRELRKVQQSDPTSMTAHLGLGFALQMSKAYDAALLEYRLAQELNPAAYAPHLAAGLLLVEQQVHEQAHQELSQAAQFSPRNPNVMAALLYAHTSAGRTEAVAEVAAELTQVASRQYVPSLWLALAHSLTGRREEAIQKLEQAYQERSPWLALVRHLPAFSRIRDDDRYPALVARIGLA